ncbi:hypothetical protein LX36DRAFT_663173 [Colletotrichum falcatum]|nr:hypothetical protein LX36DRAFT_663173 [Colletotrichum falcatum]
MPRSKPRSTQAREPTRRSLCPSFLYVPSLPLSLNLALPPSSPLSPSPLPGPPNRAQRSPSFLPSCTFPLPPSTRRGRYGYLIQGRSDRYFPLLKK